MKAEEVYKLTSIIFGVVAIVHAIRVVKNLPLNLGNWEAPLWLSAAAALLIGYLSVWYWKKAN
jgi:hypothetical protein